MHKRAGGDGRRSVHACAEQPPPAAMPHEQVHKLLAALALAVVALLIHEFRPFQVGWAQLGCC